MEQITQSLITLLGSIVTALVAYLVKSLKDYLALKGGEKAVKIAEIVAQNAVNAVEQVATTVEANSADKLQMAKDLVIKELGERGVKITVDQLDMYIEAAVKKANETWKSY